MIGRKSKNKYKDDSHQKDLLKIFPFALLKRRFGGSSPIFRGSKGQACIPIYSIDDGNTKNVSTGLIKETKEGKLLYYMLPSLTL